MNEKRRKWHNVKIRKQKENKAVGEPKQWMRREENDTMSK
eukprot:SAG31_NODE_48612_length_179_cov_1.612500_1_plen_40_part_00